MDLCKPDTMKRNIIYISVLLIVLSACTSKSPDLVVVCGWDEVFISDISKDIPAKVWTWTGEGSEGLPSFMRNKFLTTDECKPFNSGKNILITSSGGGVAYVERESGNTLFYASVPNAHSAELLSNKLLVAAASYSSEGNRLNLYNLDNPDVVIYSDSLFGAHGVYWDKKTKLLWALGAKEIRSYSLEYITGTPVLNLEFSVALPEDGGHDLVATDKRNILCLSTANSVWLFDTQKEKFIKHPDLGNITQVKSLAYNTLNGSIAYIKAAEDSWWAYYIRFAESGRVIYFPGEKIYKARWLY